MIDTSNYLSVASYFAMQYTHRANYIRGSILCVIVFIICCQICESEIIRYASETECDRYALDAVYHEKYKSITNNILADCNEFVSRVCDVVADSLSTIMSQLPDRDVSDNEERKIHVQFKSIKGAFSSKVKKMQKNITSAWEDLVTNHFDLMYDNGKSSLADYENKTIRLTDSYFAARKSLDIMLSSFVDFIKSTVRDGLNGIKSATKDALKKKDQEKKNDAEESKNESEKNKTEGEIMQEKMLEITQMIVPGFLGKVTMEVIKKKIDLKEGTKTDSEDRDTPLDDVEFDMIMVKNRIRAIIQINVPKDKGATDLARRNIYSYWVNQAEKMYAEKMESKKSTHGNPGTGRLHYKDIWKNEQQIIETLLNLMEIYP